MSEDKGGIIMKKLLLLGALLTIGATSFALDPQPVSKQSVILKKDAAGNTFSGAAELQLITKGSVIAPGDGEYTLVITPTQSSELNKDSIAFNFADIRLGETAKMVGGFKAQIYGNDTTATANPAGLHLVKIKTYEDHITTKLEYLGTDTTVLKGTNGESITGIKLMDLTTSTNQLGTLNYALTTSYTDEETLTGEIVADVIAGTTNSGSFRNMEAKVVVEVKAADLPDLSANDA